VGAEALSVSKELRSRLLTLLVLAALAAGLYLYARRADLIAPPRPVSGLLYPGLDPTAVDSLYVTLRDGYDLQLERQPGGHWRITQPTQEEARREWVELILDNLARAQVEPVEAPDGAVRAEAVGLEPPLHVVRFRAGGREETLLLGEVEPLGRMLYARRGGDDRIVLATRNLVTVLEGHPGDFVDPTLVRGLAGPVTSVLVREAGQVALDARRVGGRWLLYAPEPVLADEDRVAALVRSLTLATASRTVDATPDTAGLHALGLPDVAEREAGDDVGATRLTLATEGGTPVSIWLAAGWRDSGGEDVPAVRQGPGKVVGVPRGALNVLLNSPDFFRQHTLLAPISERAESLRIDSGGQTLLDIRRGADSRWTFSAPERLAGQPVEAERIAGHSVLSEFLARIDALEVLGFSGVPNGEPDARLIVGWTRAGQDVVDRVELYFGEMGPCVARTSERLTEGLSLDAKAVESLLDPLQAEMLRSTRAVQVDANAWSALVLVSPQAGTRRILRGAGGDWTGDDEWSRGYAIGTDLLKGFRGLQWRPGAAGADYPWEIRFEDASGATLADLRLREPAGDEEREVWGLPVVRAAVAGHDGVELLVGREWIERLDALARPPER
jgi:hypothetical protein